MKPEDLLDAVGEISEEKIHEAHRSRKARVKPWRRWVAAAAAVVLVIGGAAVALRSHIQYGACSLPAAIESAAPDTTEPAQPKTSAHTPAMPSQPLPTPSVNRALDASPQLLAAAVYPELPQQPKEYDPEKAKEYITYQEKLQEQIESYEGSLTPYLEKAIPALLGGAVGENRVCSPLNIYLALAMLAECTDGESRAQLLELLGEENLATLRAHAGALWNVNYQDTDGRKCLLSSSLWMNEALDYVPETLAVLAENYYTDSFSGEMGSEEYAAALRDWINVQTGGQLEDHISNLSLDARCVLALVTTVDFHALWMEKFDPEESMTGVFHAPAGDLEAEFLCESIYSEPYWWGAQFSAVKKQLRGGGQLWMILPEEGTSPEALLTAPELMDFLLRNKMNYAWDPSELWEQSEYVTLRLKLPKFDVSAKTDLIETLQSLGVTDIFEPGAANFSPALFDNDALQPFVSQAEHAARFGVNEEGVIGSAYTIIESYGMGGPPQPVREVDFTLDRPFLFALAGSDGLPLFVGIVNTP